MRCRLYQAMKKAVVTGSNGFIGKHLTEALKERGIEPIALTRDQLYLNIPQLTEVLLKHNPNYIIALHSYGNHRMQVDETRAVMANYFATYNLLKASEFINLDAFINVASSSIYGIKDHPMKESDNLEPDTFYAATKAGMVHLARAFATQYNRPICSIVPFSVYGEGEASFRFIPLVIKHLMTNIPMQVTEATHDWIHVDDFVDGLLTVMDNIKDVQGELVNIGTGITTANLKIIQTLEAISGKRFNVDNSDNSGLIHIYDSPLWEADIHKLSTFSWSPKIPLVVGLRRCWEYYIDNGN